MSNMMSVLIMGLSSLDTSKQMSIHPLWLTESITDLALLIDNILPVMKHIQMDGLDRYDITRLNHSKLLNHIALHGPLTM